MALLPLMSTSCSSLEGRLDAAAQKQGHAEARVTLPALPADCRKKEPHADIQAGMEAISVLKRERGQLDKANSRVGRCAGFFDHLRDKLK